MAGKDGRAHHSRGVRRSRADNNEGTVYQAKDGYWKAELFINGTRKKRSAKTEALASVKLEDLKRLRDQGDLMAKPEQSVAQYLAHWLEDSKKPRLRAHSYDMYRAWMRHVIDAVGTMKLGALQTAHINHLYADLARRDYAPKSIHHIHVTLKQALQDAVYEEIIPKNPAVRAKAPKVQDTQFETLTKDEVEALWRVTENTRWYALWVVLATTGLRIGEALALTWADIRSGPIKVRKNLSEGAGVGKFVGDVKTKSSKRDVPLSEKARRALDRHRIVQNELRLATASWEDRGLIFPNTVGGFMETTVVGAALKRHLAAADAPIIRVHDLRHTAATHMLEQGLQANTVREILGHSHVSITLGLYGHVTPGMKQSVADAMDRLFGA